MGSPKPKMNVPKPRQLASGSWFIQLRLGGESIPVTMPTEKACIDQATLLKAEHNLNKAKSPRTKLVKATQEKAITLSQAIDRYIGSRSNILSPSTIMGYSTIHRTRFKDMMDRKLYSISDSDWRNACNAEAAVCSAKTLKNAWLFIRTVIRNETDLTPPKIALPQVVPNEHEFLDPEQIKIFVAAVHGTDIEIPALLALSSMRRSELKALLWEDNIDLKNRRIKVKGAIVPNEKFQLVRKESNKNPTSTRYVPIVMDELYNALEAVQPKAGPVVSCNLETLRRTINRICVHHDLPQVGTHGLRHSFASLAYHLGLSEEVTMAIGGWSDRTTVHKIYTHIAKCDILKSTTKMIDFYKGTQDVSATAATDENGAPEP